MISFSESEYLSLNTIIHTIDTVNKLFNNCIFMFIKRIFLEIIIELLIGMF